MYLTEFIFLQNKHYFYQIKKYINYNIFNNIFNKFNDTSNYNIIDSLIIIFLIDLLLINIFNKKARYYQLHCCINLIISYRIYPDIKNFIYDPLNSYKIINNNLDSYLIISLHFYHLLITKKLSFIEKIHHLLFVVFGVLPAIFFINTNQIYLGYIVCSGIPGIFEYGLLSLYKNNIISQKLQKCYTSYLYNYFRYPLGLYSCFLNLIMWNYNKILNNENIYFTIYINLLLFLNVSVFNHLTIKSYYIKKI